MSRSLGRTMATRSPRFTPASRSPRAAASARRSSSAKVRLRSSRITATWSGRAAAVARRSEPMTLQVIRRTLPAPRRSSGSPFALDEARDGVDRAEVLLGDLRVLDAHAVAVLNLLDELDEAQRVDDPLAE